MKEDRGERLEIVRRELPQNQSLGLDLYPAHAAPRPSRPKPRPGTA